MIADEMRVPMTTVMNAGDMNHDERDIESRRYKLPTLRDFDIRGAEKISE